MDILIAVRHGDYNGHDRDDRGLTEYGRNQIKILAVKIQKLLSESRKTKIFHSPRPRAVQTAGIISDLISCETKELAVLVGELSFNGEGIMEELVNEVGSDIDCVITVGHFEAVPGLVGSFIEVGPNVPNQEQLDVLVDVPGKGEGFVLELSTGKITKI